MAELQSTRRIGPVWNGVSLVRVLLRLCLEVELPGPRLLEPVGTICHLTGQTRPWFISLADDRGGGRVAEGSVWSRRGEELAIGYGLFSSST